MEQMQQMAQQQAMLQQMFMALAINKEYPQSQEPALISISIDSRNLQSSDHNHISEASIAADGSSGQVLIHDNLFLQGHR